MKSLLAFLLLAVSAFAATPPVITVDLYGNVFLDGANTNAQIGDFARNNPALAPQVDGAVRELVVAARARIASDVKAATDSAAAQVAAKEAEKQAAIAAHAKAKASELDALKAEVAKLKEEIAALKAPPAK